MTSLMSDQKYLLKEQYGDASKLGARAGLHQRFSTNKYGWMLWAFDQLDLGPEARVLELGCGPGALWTENRTRIPGGWKVVLTDLSAGMVEEAQRALGDLRGRFQFMAVDGQELPFEDASFDGVIANHMLYHVPDVAKALSESRRVLRPGATFYAATNGQRHMGELDELARTFDCGLMGPSGEYSFSLENGAEQLGEWFDHVEMSRYEDSLLVTEAEPLIAYILSLVGNARSVLVGEKLAGLTTFVERELADKGAIRITKNPGLFKAQRGAG